MGTPQGGDPLGWVQEAQGKVYRRKVRCRLHNRPCFGRGDEVREYYFQTPRRLLPLQNQRDRIQQRQLPSQPRSHSWTGWSMPKERIRPLPVLLLWARLDTPLLSLNRFWGHKCASQLWEPGAYLSLAQGRRHETLHRFRSPSAPRTINPVRATCRNLVRPHHGILLTSRPLPGQRDLRLDPFPPAAMFDLFQAGR